MSRQHLVVVGGGLAGLSTGCYALASGWDVTVVEHATRLGGVCTAWSRGDYTIDGCIHWLTGGPYARIYEELHIVPPVELRPLDAFLTYRDVLTGTRVEIARDPARLRAELLAIAGDDGDTIDHLLAAAHQLAALAPPIDHPAEIATIRERLADAWSMRHQIGALLHVRQTVRDWCGANLKSARLAQLLSRIVPDDAPMLVLLMILGYLGRGWLSRPVGGTAAFRDALIARYAALGGVARLASTVDEIVVGDDRARGVRLADGSVIEADAVVSTASAPETVLRLLGGRYGADSLRERLASWPLFEPIVLVTFGVAAPLADLPPTLLLDGIPGLEVGGRHNGHFYVRVHNEERGGAPPGHAVVQVMLQTDHDWWAARGAQYAAAKDAVAASLVAELSRYIPALAGAVRMVDVATPLTYWREARSWHGVYEGWKPTAAALLGHVGKVLPGLADLYLAGQWVEPGGGVPMALLSGRQVVQILCRHAGRAFRAGG